MSGCRNSGKGGFGGGLRRGLADFTLAWALFWIVGFAASADMRAHAVPLQVIGKQIIHPGSHAELRVVAPQAMAYRRYRAPAGNHDLVLLSVAFAALAAGNLAFWRHLRRAYASPRRNVWRRD